MKHEFDPETEECEDIDLTESDDILLDDPDDDIIADYWLTPDALDILNDLHRKQQRENRRTTAAVILGCVILIVGAAIFGFRHFIWG